MKFNQWTLGLAALGVVSLASAAKAEEKMNALQSALSSTTISGYVDVSAQWNFGTGNLNNPPYAFGGDTKADGFNLNVVQLTIAKPLDEGEWSAGYRADLWIGPDANVIATASALGGRETYYPNRDFAIRQAYVALRTPVGNGIDWKGGVFDSLLGYESIESGNNPNYTRSYGYTLEPTTLTGILASYRFCDAASLSVGVANTTGPSINARAFDTNLGSNSRSEAQKTYTASLALTAPKDWGWAAGSTLYAAVLYGYNDVENTPGGNGNDLDNNTLNLYVGGTLATPVAGLKVGAAFDYVNEDNTSGSAWALAGYASYQATEKLSVHARAEYAQSSGSAGSDLFGGNGKIFALTGTIQYDLWQNVISRVELRWDHSCNGIEFGNNAYSETGGKRNAVMLAANFIYKF